MEFNELIANFATRHNVPDLEVQDGVTALNIDEILVSIVSLGVWCKYSSETQMTVRRAFLEWLKGSFSSKPWTDCQWSRHGTGQKWRFSADADTTGRRNGFCHSAGRGRMRGGIVRRPCANSS